MLTPWKTTLSIFAKDNESLIFGFTKKQHHLWHKLQFYKDTVRKERELTKFWNSRQGGGRKNHSSASQGGGETDRRHKETM